MFLGHLGFVEPYKDIGVTMKGEHVILKAQRYCTKGAAKKELREWSLDTGPEQTRFPGTFGDWGYWGYIWDHIGIMENKMETTTI